jgi:hypothetical protein
MARNEHTPEDLDKLADEAAAAFNRLRAIAESMRQSKMPTILLQSATATNLHLPELIRWAEKSEADARAQIRSYLNDQESTVAIRKRYNQNQKLAAAKKAVKKKAT